MKRTLLLSMLLCSLPLTATSPLTRGRVYFIRSASFSQVVVSPNYHRLLERSLKQAAGDPEMKAVILEINTPGGRLDSALTIKDLITGYVTAKKQPLIAFVNSHAISAGALVALSCRHLAMVEAGTIGDAAPVAQQDGKMVRLDEKAVSVVRGVFKALAEKYGRPARVLMAMADSDIVLTRAQDGIDKEKGKLLTLTAGECRTLGIADPVVPDLAALLRHHNLEGAEVIYLDYSDSDRILLFFTSPLVSGILLTLGIVGLFFEVKTPGWGVGGTVGLLCLAAFFTTQIMLNPSVWGAPVLFVIGVILLAIEIFIIPGFGLVGITGLLLIFGALLWALGMDNLRQSAAVLAASLVASALLIALLFKLVPKTRTFRKIVLLDSGKDYVRPTDHDNLSLQKGTRGTALTPLRPAGIIKVDEAKIDAVSEGDFINAGETVVIMSIDGMKVTVRKEN